MAGSLRQVAMQLTDSQRRTVAALTRATMRRLNAVSEGQRALAEELCRPPPTASVVRPDPAVVRVRARVRVMARVRVRARVQGTLTPRKVGAMGADCQSSLLQAAFDLFIEEAQEIESCPMIWTCANSSLRDATDWRAASEQRAHRAFAAGSLIAQHRPPPVPSGLALHLLPVSRVDQSQS